MSKISLIAAITADRALGRNGDMIYHISADLRRFKEITMGHPVVMGRRTFESLPHPLPGRRNVVVSRNADYRPEGAEVYPTLQAALASCASAEPMVIGGGQIYAQCMTLASTIYLTEIDATAPDADTFFPAIDPAQWHPTEESDWHTDPKSGVRFRYVTLEKK